MKVKIKIVSILISLGCLFGSVGSADTNPTYNIHKVLLVVAMDTEADPIIKALNLKKSSHIFAGLPMQGYEGKYNDKDIFLIINGKDPMYNVRNVGTQPAVLATYLGAEYFHPDLVISIGTAGGLAKSNAKVGDIYLSKKVYFYDRRIAFPEYVKYGLGGYTSMPFNSKEVQQMGLKQGTVCSGDSFDNNKADTKIILKQKCNAKEMEAAGVAWVSMLIKKPMFAMKGITDLVGDAKGGDEFEKNFPSVTVKLAEKLKVVLTKIG